MDNEEFMKEEEEGKEERVKTILSTTKDLSFQKRYTWCVPSLQLPLLSSQFIWLYKKKKKIPPKILVFPHNFNFIAMNIGHFSDMVLLPEVNSHFLFCFRHIQIQVGIVTPVNKVI